MISLRTLLLSTLTSWLLTQPALADNAKPPIPSARSVTADALYLLDTRNTLSAEQVLAEPDEAWRHLSAREETPDLGIRRGTLWVKLPLPAAAQETRWLHVANENLEQLRLYSVSNGKMKALPRSTLHNAQGFPIYPLQAAPGEKQTILLATSSHDRLSLPLSIYSSNTAILERNGIDQLLEWAAAGIAVGLILLAIASQWRATSSARGWLACWLGAALLSYTEQHRLLQWAPDDGTSGNITASLVAQSALLLLTAPLLRAIYQTHERHPRLHMGVKLYLPSTAMVLLPLALAGNLPLFRALFIVNATFLSALALVIATVNREASYPGTRVFALAIGSAIAGPLGLTLAASQWQWIARNQDLLILVSLTISAAIALWGLDRQTAAQSVGTATESIRKAIAEALGRTQQQVLARVSLNLGPVLQGFFSLIERLAKARLPTDQSRVATHIARSAERLRVTLDNLEDMALLRQEELPVTSRDFCLDRLISNAIQTHLSRARATGLTIGLDINRELPRLFKGDGPRLQRMLTSLLDHAMQHAYRGHLMLRAERAPTTEAGPVRVRFLLEDSSIHTSAQNDLASPDMGDDVQSALADLNLEACRKLAKRLGGELQLSTSPNGTRHYALTVALDFCAKPVETDIPGLRQQTLLLVDTDSADRIALTDEARDWGMNVLYAQDLEQGTELLDGRQPPDVIIFNPRLPEAPQWLSSTLLAEIDSLPRDGLIVLSAKDLTALRAGEELAGALFISKPVRHGVLGLLMQELIALNNERENMVRHRPLTVVVDDNPVNARLLKQQLERLGFRPHFCVDGQEALDFAEQHWQSIGALIIDSELQRLGGTEMPRALRLMAARRAEAPLPLLSMTSQQDSDTIASLQSAGAMAVLSKPVSSVALARELRRALISAQA